MTRYNDFLPIAASLFLLIISCIISSKKHKNLEIINPLSVFFGLWLFILVLLEFNQSLQYFYSQLSFNSALWLSVAFVCFFIGGIIPIYLTRISCPISGYFHDSISDDVNYKLFWYLNALLLILFISTVIYKYNVIYHKYGGILCALLQVKNDVNSGVLKYPLYLNFFTLPGYLLITNLGFLSALKGNRIAYLLGFVTLLFSLLNSMSIGLRGQFLNFSLLFSISNQLTSMLANNENRLRHFARLGISLALVFVVLAFVIYFRSFEGACNYKNELNSSFGHSNVYLTQTASYGNKANSSLSSTLISKDIKNSNTLNLSIFDRFFSRKNTITFRDALLGQSYIYLVGPVPAYSYFQNHPWPSHYWGMQTFYGLYSVINSISELFQKDFFFRKLSYDSQYAKIMLGPYNSTIYLTYIFSDFGYFGIILFSFIFGLLSNYFYVAAKRTKSMVSIQMAALWMVGITLSIRGIITSGVFFWVLIGLIMAQDQLFKYVNHKEIIGRI